MRVLNSYLNLINDGTAGIFNYRYDALNRLTRGEVSPTVMSEVITYDVMGNIASMNRDGSSGTYHYNGNQLSSITGGLATGSYAYDPNGNAVTDGRNGMTLTYNYLNLPVTASKTGLSLIYTYDAMGQKLKKVSSSSGTTDYVNGIQYTNNQIDFIQTEEGVARRSGNNYIYEYNLTDHLGNVRYTFGTSGGTMNKLQVDNYYAFGKRNSPAFVNANDNKYLYNGKELQEELLGQYDYGARFYDPVIGRWNVVDPLAEKRDWLSPYNYVQNNPIIRIDPFGALDDYYRLTDNGLEYLGNDGKGDAIKIAELSNKEARNVSKQLKGSNTDAQTETALKVIKDLFP